MSTLPQRVKGISHPLVNEIYLKKNFGKGRKEQDVLVIETHHEQADETGHDEFDSYLIDLLSDLHDLQMQIEKKIGHFDRVDIISH